MFERVRSSRLMRFLRKAFVSLRPALSAMVLCLVWIALLSEGSKHSIACSLQEICQNAFDSCRTEREGLAEGGRMDQAVRRGYACCAREHV